MDAKVSTLAKGHGAFFLASGLWPIFHFRSFEKATGPKTDEWLVKTIGLLLATTGAALLAAGARSKKPPRELGWLAAGQSGVLAAISAFYSMKGRISKIYLLDTLIESAIVAAWVSQRGRLKTAA